MRLSTAALIAAAASALLATAAEAQSRKPLRVTVQPRSYLDAGKVAPVGSLSGYAQVDRYSVPSMAPAVIRGDTNLPSRVGGGRNPFQNIF